MADDDSTAIATDEAPQSDSPAEDEAPESGGSLASLAQPSAPPDTSSLPAGRSDSALASALGPNQAQSPSSAPAAPQAPLQGLGGRLRGVLYGLAIGGVPGAVAGGIAPNTARTHFQENEQVRAARTQQAQAAAQSAQQNVQFESVKAADSHIQAMKEAQRIDQLNEQSRVETAKTNAEYQGYLMDTFGIAPDLNIAGNGQEVHDQATGALQTLAGENGGQIPPVHAVTVPHTPDDPKFKVGVYAPSQQDLTRNQDGFRKLVDTSRAVQGLPPIDDLTWNSGGGQGYKGQRQMAQDAMKFLSPVQSFTEDNLPAVLAQRKQQLTAYQQHTDQNGNPDADPATVKALSASVDFLQSALDDVNTTKNKQAADLENTKANTPSGQLETQVKQAELKKANLDLQQTPRDARTYGSAFDPNSGERTYTTLAAANANGLQGFEEMKSGDIQKAKESNRMWNDVQINQSRYLAAAKNAQANPLTTKDQVNLNDLLNKAGLFDMQASISQGGEIKLPLISALAEGMSRESKTTGYQALSPQARALYDGYLRQLTAIPAFQKAMTSIGRTNKEMLDLELQFAPLPTMDPKDITNRLGEFQENIDQGTQGLVRFPDLKQPKDIRKEYESQQHMQPPPRPSPPQPQPRPRPQGQGGWGAQFGGVPRQ